MSGESNDGETVQADQSEAEALASFDAGFNLSSEPATQTPQPQAEESASKEPEQTKPVFAISEEQWRDVESKLGRLAQLDDHARKLDTIAGNFGGLKQIVDGIRQRGGATKFEKGQLKRLSEQYPELADALSDDLGEILSAAPAGIDAAEFDKRVEERVTKAIEADRVSRQKEWLSDNHPDWVGVLRSDDFKAYQLTLTPTDNQELTASTDGRLVGKHIKAFKDLKAKAATLKTPPAPAQQAKPAASPRQSRIESAVPAKGAGGGPPAPDPADDFNKGWGLKGHG